MTLPVQQLFKDLRDRKGIYVKKQDHFAALSLLFKDKVGIWNVLDRSPVVVNKKTVSSVYSHDNVKGV